MAGLFLASPAIRSCFVDTLSGFKAPSCFSETTLFTTVPRFPRPGPPRAAFPDVNSTIRALRLPAPTTGSLMYSLPRSHFASPSSLPRSGDFRMGLAPHPAAVPSANFKVGRCRTSQVPGESIPYLCPALGPRSVRTGLTLTSSSMLPPLSARRRH